MRYILSSLILAAALAGGCGTTPTAAPPPQVQIDTALAEITPARQAMTALAKAGKITWSQDDAAQAALTDIRGRLLAAQTLLPTNAAVALDLLSKALADLAAYQGAAK